MQTLIQDLTAIVGVENTHVNEVLSAHTTFKIGGPADVLVEPSNIDQIRAVLDACRKANVTVRFLGLGSNVLACDEGVCGVVLKLAERFSAIEVDGTYVTCQAGASNEEVALAAMRAGLAGYEFASGIPGTIGGAAIMNAGAYGGEFKGVAVSVDCITPEGALVEVAAQDADWSYRHSMMMDRGFLVVGAKLRLEKDDPDAIFERIEDLRIRREEKQPLEMPSAGSTFKRPEGYFAGKLIQDAGMQGYRVGGAQVSEKHAGFVVNAGGATAKDVRTLIADVQRSVLDKEGVRLEPEVRMWGFDD